MKAGHELDARVAALMGWKQVTPDTWVNGRLLYQTRPLDEIDDMALDFGPSDCEDDAGLVLNRLAAQGYMITVYYGRYRDEGIKARCCVLRPRDIDRVDAVADTRPLAICKAALIAAERWGK
ncbi:MAG: hypothetical protein GY832_26295 [Chloroflexi bacterium]|nr:hypothetical protein [Chloroflexota bacterium]